MDALWVWIGATPLVALCVLWMWALPNASAGLTPDGQSVFELAWGRGALISELSHAGQWWRLWSAPLAHATPAHLSVNLLTFTLTLCVAWRSLNWRGLHIGAWSSTVVYVSALLCFLTRALSAGGWSGGLSGGVMALMSFVALELARTRLRSAWPWGGLCLFYALGVGGADIDQLVHLTGLALGGLMWLARPFVRERSRAQWVTRALLTLSGLGLWTAWGQLREPEALWARWRAYPQIAELGGPALGNGLCFVGPLNPGRALDPPWRDGDLITKSYQDSGGETLLISPVSDQTSVATLLRPAERDHPLAVVCLTPLHLWPQSPQRQRRFKVLFDQLESARAHISP